MMGEKKAPSFKMCQSNQAAACGWEDPVCRGQRVLFPSSLLSSRDTHSLTQNSSGGWFGWVSLEAGSEIGSADAVFGRWSREAG